MGFNAARRYRDDKRRDIILMVVAILVIGIALAWAAGLI